MNKKKPNVVASVPFNLLFREIDVGQNDGKHSESCGCGGRKNRRQHNDVGKKSNDEYLKKTSEKHRSDADRSDQEFGGTKRKRSVGDSHTDDDMIVLKPGKETVKSKMGKALNMKVVTLPKCTESGFILGSGKVFKQNFRIDGKDDVKLRVTFEAIDIKD